MKPSPFNYFNADTIQKAVDALSINKNSKIIAGGQSLVPMMNFRLAQPDLLIDISNINELTVINEDIEYIEIGSLLTHSNAIKSICLKKHFPIIPKAINNVAHHTIRNQGTVGGSIANADPASEWPLLVTLLECSIKVQNKTEKREILSEDFFESHFVTNLKEDEIITSIKIPKIKNSYGWSFFEEARRDGDFAIVETGAIIEIEKNNLIKKASIAIGGVDEKVIKLKNIENLLVGLDLRENLCNFEKQDIDNQINPFSDNHSSIEYKKHLSFVLVKKAINSAKDQILNNNDDK